MLAHWKTEITSQRCLTEQSKRYFTVDFSHAFNMVTCTTIFFKQYVGNTGLLTVYFRKNCFSKFDSQNTSLKIFVLCGFTDWPKMETRYLEHTLQKLALQYCLLLTHIEEKNKKNNTSEAWSRWILFLYAKKWCPVETG